MPNRDLIGRFFLKTTEVIKYAVNYKSQLETAEVITGTPVVDVDTAFLRVTSIAIAADGKSFTFNLHGTPLAGPAVPGTYRVGILVSTSISQTFEDEIEFVVEQGIVS